MKKILLLLVILMPFVTFAQSKSNNEDFKIALDTQINGCRVIATSGKVIVSQDELLQNGQPLTVYLMHRNNNKEKSYSIRFSVNNAGGEETLLFLTVPQPIILTLDNGQVMTFTSGNDFGWTELGHDSYGNNHVLYHLSRDLGFSVTREQINDMIQSKIVKVQFSLNSKRVMEYDIKDNLLSLVLDQQLKAIEEQMQNPLPVDYSTPLKTTH